MTNTTHTAPKLVSVPAKFAPGRPAPRTSWELEDMREGMADLLDLLSYARPHNSAGERVFLNTWLIPRLEALGVAIDMDGFGNLWVNVAPAVGAVEGAANILWSCHVDTVHAPNAERQQVRFQADGRTVELVKAKPGRCLGADDGAGLWLMLQMIAAGVAGGYVFHRGEEVGRLGSIYVADCEPERLSGFDACVAFDRRDYDNFITHQLGQRCASEAFSRTMCAAFNSTGQGLTYASDDTGSYTDSYSYSSLVSECCNMSVGYDSEHGPRETLDALHLWRLRQAIVRADFSGVVCERDCTEVDDWASYGYGGGYGSGTWAQGGREGSGGSRMGLAAWGGSYADDLEGEGLLDMIRKHPAAVAALLAVYALDERDILEHMSPSEQSRALADMDESGLDDLDMDGAGGWRHG